MADKIFNQLPVVLQTKAIKNFFEATVEQLYSEANITPINGFIGKQTGEDKDVTGAFIEENTADRELYSLSPVVNNLNPLSGDSENLVYYDEFIDTLQVYGVTTRDHNKIFGSRYRTFMPPIDIDKFINFQEYYWYPAGPSTITLTANDYNLVNIDRDIIGKKTYTHAGTTLRNGMIIMFADNNKTIPAGDSTTAVHKAGVEYIVGGVGEGIFLVEKAQSSATLYGGSKLDKKDYIVLQRDADNKTAWSRVNHWYHRNNFIDAGDALPDRKYRGKRPILEFDKHLELYNHGTSNYGIVDIAIVALSKDDVEGEADLTIDTHQLEDGDTVFFPNEANGVKEFIYTVSGASSSIVLTPTSSTKIANAQTIVVAKGNVYEGADYLFDGVNFAQAQKKVQINQPPLFCLYDDAGKKLDDSGLYNNSEFKGSRIFGYKVGTGKADPELGFPLTYTPYKAVSEITFENFIQSERVKYQTFGATSKSSVLGSYYYKLNKDVNEYHSYWKLSDDKNEQKIITTHYISRGDVDDKKLVYNIGATPSPSSITSSGYDILVKVNGAIVTDYVYNAPDLIKFNSFTFSKGDIIDVEVASESGITKVSNSRFEIPLSWRTNPFNSEIEVVAEPQYLSHFKRYIERQEGFVGDPLGSSNFQDLTPELTHAKDIVQTDQDIILSAFLLDDQPHNLIESLRFSAREYEKYRARLIKEITTYYNTFPVDNLSYEYILEKVLRNLISYSVGKDVFGSTYILPFGDNYKEEIFDVGDLTNTSYTMSNYADLETIENSLLVYKLDPEVGTNELLVIGKDYELSSVNPITIAVSKTVNLGDSIIAKLYNEDRDSAECPATPSTMGMYPLYEPCFCTDDTFKETQQLIRGHDGSMTALTGTVIDNVLLEFETRIYNTTMQLFRDNNSLPRLNVGDVRAGAFRTNNFSPREYTDLLRNAFNNWAGANRVDHVANEFFDETDTFTWNYRGDKDLPGHWRGWYEYYYDTVRPHTHPWEMLGFLDKPTWWEAQYGTNYGSKNFDMWGDLEKGIIRQGLRANVAKDEYLIDNNWRRVGLSSVLPVDEDAKLLSPGTITDTGTTKRLLEWTNRRRNFTDVADQFYDSTGNNNLPNGITITYGSSDAARVLFDANAAPQAGTFWDYDGTISGSVSGSGFAEGMDGFTTPYVFVDDDVTNKRYQLYNYTIDNLTDASGIIVKVPTPLQPDVIGITVNGTPLLNPANTSTWNNEGVWNYKKAFRNESPDNGTYFIEPEDAGLEDWDDTVHSPIVGWSFDGLPIYGPYGYREYAANGSIVSGTITAIKSAFKLRETQRPSGPRGGFSGEFVQDYTYAPEDPVTYAGEAGSPKDASLGEFNMRFGVTPESPNTPIYFYVATIDDNGDPMFPYCIGGTEATTNTYEGKYYAAPVEAVLNNTGSITDTGEIVAISSTQTVTPTTDTVGTAGVWRFGDGAPVENAWKYSCGYPFAVAEAMLLSRPGKFVTSFSDPMRITTPALDKHKIINKTSRTPFSFIDPDHFCIHGDVADGKPVRNVGYTQFIHSWLTYQDLNTTTDYAEKLRLLNIKLSHRMAGFTDKDTLTVRADQTSLTTTSQSLLIPNENVDVVVHSSPYKTRNFYTGMSIQKTQKGYKIKGFDKNHGYFEILRRNYRGNSTSVVVGGEAVDYVVWQPETSYTKETIVSYNNAYYRAPTLVTGSPSFLASLWTRLPSLPQKDGVKATIFLDDLPYVDRVDYQAEYATYQEVVDVIVGLGAYQQSIGFDFGGFDSEINDVRNWNYVVQQFLFWVAGGWEVNNTLDLSPLANQVKFTSTSGMVAGINRTDKNQFTLLDQDGRAIHPQECEIVREGNTIEIVPPAGTQVYGCMLFTKEIEHALIFDNVTDFNDVLFDQVFNHSQRRLKIKGKKTANWSGLFSSEGFIIQNDELKPNLDNMAQSLGRYHELGFVPVEKQIYEQARGLFGYQEREYLNNLEIQDDDQFEFYKGMLQSKGTLPSLQKIAKSTNIVQGDMNVYDEWALKVGDFGDLENDQTIELKLEKSDITNDPQLITLQFPEDTTGVIDYVKIIEAKHKYHKAPIVEIAAPSGKPPVQATAKAVLEANGVLSAINVTNAGTGYEQPVRLKVIAGELNIANVSSTFNKPVITTAGFTDPDVSALSLTTLRIIKCEESGNTTANFNLSSVTSMANIATLINEDATINSSITASTISSNVLRRQTAGTFVIGEEYVIASVGTTNFVAIGASSNTVGTQFEATGAGSGTGTADGVIPETVLSITGNDFALVEVNTTLDQLNLQAGRYQPRQRFNIASVDNHPTKGTGATTASDITVTVEDVAVPSNKWVYDAGSRQSIAFNASTSGNPGRFEGDGTTIYTGNVVIPLSTTIDVNNIAKENNLTYKHANVFVNGFELTNVVGDARYTLTTNELTIHNVQRLPGSSITNGANVYVVESPTIDFEDSYFGDVPGANIKIKVATNDDIAIITKSKRLYEITPDSKTDDVILIDIDDTSRFLKKPIGVREQNLWPTTSNLDYTGIKDNRFTKIPNAGYVNSANVDFSSFDVASISDMFRPEFLVQPDAGSTIHVAMSENRDWNVYKLKEANTDVSFIERESDDATAYLYANVSLFNYTDSNQIGEADLNRFLDYHIVVKDAIVSDRFAVWVNEEVVNNKSVRLTNIEPKAMTEAFIEKIEPAKLKAITAIGPAASGYASAGAMPIGSNTVKIFSSTDILSDAVNPQVQLNSSNVTADEQVVHNETYAVSNINVSEGSFTITEPGLTGNIDPGNLSATFFGKTQFTSANHKLVSGDKVKIIAGAYSGDWQVEGAGQNVFAVDIPYIANGPISGNVVMPAIKITTQTDHGIDEEYAGKKVAIHASDEKYYNNVYQVAYVPSANTLVLTGFPIDDKVDIMTANTAVVTTLDHDRISLNNSNIKIDNITSLDGMIDSLNRGFALRRGWIGRQGSFQMSIPMLKSPYNAITGQTPQQIKGATPYVTNFNHINKGGFTGAGGIPVNPITSMKKGFNVKMNGGSTRGKKIRAPRGSLGSGVTTTMPSTTLATSPFSPGIVGPGTAANSPYTFSSVMLPNMSAMAPAGLGAPQVPTTPPSLPGLPQNVSSNLFKNLLGSGVVSGLGGGMAPPRQPVIPTIKTGSTSGQTNSTGAVVLHAAAVVASAPKACGALVIPPPPLPPNNPPSAMDDSFSTAEDTAVSGNMLANDSDPEGNTLTLKAGSGPGGFDITPPSKGTLSGLNANGDFTYTPNTGFSGNDSFTYRINDSAGKFSNKAKVHIAVNATPVIPPPPKPVPVHRKCEFQAQSTNSRGVDDTWFYHIPVKGDIKIIIDMDAAADALTAYQSRNRNNSGGTRMVGTADSSLRNATSAEKDEIRNNHSAGNFTNLGPGGGFRNANNYHYGSSSHGANSRPPDFQRGTPPAGGIRNCGVLEIKNWDPSKGEYLRVFVSKESSVYRYHICYPSRTAGTPAPQQPTQTATTTKRPNTTKRPTTPIFRPTKTPTTKVKVPNVLVGGNMGIGGGGRGGGISFHKYGGAGPHFAHNFGGFSLAPMAGYTHIPSVFKKTVKKVSTLNAGRLQPLGDDRYVNVSQQRISGGINVPLAAPIPAPIPFVRRAIRGVDIALVPGGSTFGNSKYFGNDNLNNVVLKIGSDGYSYSAISVPGLGGAGGAQFASSGPGGGTGTGGTDGAGGIAGVNGIDGFQRLLNRQLISPKDGSGGSRGTSGGPGTSTVTMTSLPGPEPTIIPGGPVFDSTNAGRDVGNNFVDTLSPAETINSEDAPLNPDVEYTDEPIITFTPKTKVTNNDGSYSYEPAGPTAYIPIHAPGPQLTLTEDDMIGLTPGDEVIINTKKITIQGTPAATLKEFECAGGFGFSTTAGQTANGTKSVTLDSCGQVPLTFRDGCAGGTYKEVLDFHIVKNFSLTDITLPSVTVTHSPGIVSTTGSHSGSTVNTSASSQNGTSVTPQQTHNVNHTGGKGYKVGDRLRVVGGTPVASPFGAISELCIEIPGMFYSDAANVHVFIGDGTTPGSQAEAGTPVVDADGSITSVPILFGGAGYDPANPPKVRIVDTGPGHERGAKIPAKIRPIIKTKSIGPDGKEHDTAGLPERPAKFVVTAVDPSDGTILSLRVIDRGIYKEFPADLSTGIPLEYDAILLGDKADGAPPLRNASGLGQFHPITGDRLDTPGNYDPTAGKYGELTQGVGQTYGTGARVFLTSREIPDCSERADVRNKLGLPDMIVEVPTVEHLANQLNNGLQKAGYDPVDVNFSVVPINPDMDELKLQSPIYDGVEFDELTPGFLDKLGLPAGDYNPDMTPHSAVNGTPTNDTNLGDDGVRRLLDGEPGSGGSGLGGGIGGPGGQGGGGVGGPGGPGAAGGSGIGDPANATSFDLLGRRGVPGNLGNLGSFGVDETGYALPEEVMVIYGVDIGGFNADGSTILGSANVVYVGDLFQYELRTLEGDPINSTEDARDCRVLYLESQRYANENEITTANTTFTDANIPSTKEEFDQIWLDDDGTGKWAYYDNVNNSITNQTALVDPKYIKNTIVYDSTTGEKDFDYDMWDPFKGVFPSFVDAEITYFSEHDPVVYSAKRAVFGSEQVGQIWWDTSTIRYYWYEQGSNKQRWLNWGKSFPGSAIALLEWVESKVPPLEYTGTGTPKNGSDFIVERTVDPSTGQSQTYYYFWVQNQREVSTKAAQKQGRKFSTFDLAKYLADPIGQGINTVSFISAGAQNEPNMASFVMSNLTRTLREDEQNIQINLSRNLNPIGLKHASWKLLREADNNSDIPDDLANKMIDSLAEVDAAGNTVPADNLSEVERYGIQFRPRQTMYKKPKEARRALQYIVNDIMADVKLNTLNTTWQDSMSSMNYIETVNWFAVKRVDGLTNEKIRYDSSYKAAFTVGSVKELDSLFNVVDGTVVMVRASQADRYQLWRYNGRTSNFEQIAIQNETIKLKDTIFKDDVNETMQTELREFLYVLKDNIFLGTENFNKVFFELMRYALGEQQELDWAFKTSYVYIEKEEEDLTQRVGYKPDNFDSVVEYFNEVKPYTAKIREYKDGKRAPIEYIKDQMLSDFDIPPFADKNVGEIRTLDFELGPDRDIMSTVSDYKKAYGGYDIDQLEWDTANVPVRTGNVSMVFDRVDWRLTETNHNVSAKAYSVSIGDMIANVNAANIATISNTATNSYTASSRIFKLDPEVRAQFDIEVDTYFGANSSSNTSIVENATQMQIAVAAGAFNGTLTMIKQKVGGTWQGEEFDANVFTRIVAGRDPLELQTAYGYDTAPFDAAEGFGDNWDEFINVQNFEGIFSGDSTYREGGVTYEGFDGWTFNHLLYGEERPEELVYLSPLENLVMHVRTDPNAFDANGSVTDSISVGPYVADNISTSDSNNIVTVTSALAAPLLNNGNTVTLAGSASTILDGDYAISNLTSTTFTIEKAGITANIISTAGDTTISSGVDAVAVEYIVHQDLFGQTEYLRILTDGSSATTTAKVVNAWDTEIEVTDPSVLPVPTPGIPAAVWLDHSERIEYNRISGNKLKGITRGTRGTTIPNGPAYVYNGDQSVRGNTYIAHPTGVSVIGASSKDVFDMPENQGGSSGFLTRDPDVAVWLKADGSTKSLTDRTNRSTVTTIGAFLHGDLVSSVGFDSVAWDSTGWDSI